MNELVSLIVPVYNVHMYINRCMQSLIHQTYSNLEIILVDDGSTDESGLDCDYWAQNDSRVQVYHKENGGLSDARNFGFLNSRGTWICFIDSDDWIKTDFVQRLLETAIKTGSEIVQCQYQVTDGESNTLEERNSYVVESYDKMTAFGKYLNDEIYGVVWNKIYHRSLVENLPFRIGVLHEDEFWTYQAVGAANRVSRIEYCGYYYYQRQGSIMNSRVTPKTINDRIQSQLERIEYVKEYFPQYINVIYLKYCFFCIDVYQKTFFVDSRDKCFLRKRIINDFRKELKNVLHGTWNKKLKIRLVLFAIFPTLYCKYILK